MTSKHVLLLPMMAQGHLKPFLQLAHQIKTKCRGLTLTILSTPRNVQLLREMSLDNVVELEKPEATGDFLPCSVVRLVQLPFLSSDHGLPDGVENTNALALKDMIKLLHASTALEAPLRRFIAEEIVEKEGLPPVCIVSDWFLGWAVQVAKSFGSLSITFSTAGAYGTAAYLSIWKDLPHQSSSTRNGKEFRLSNFPETHRFEMSHLSPIARAADGTDKWSKFFGPQASMSMASSGWLCNTVEELEPLGLSVLRSYLQLPVWAVGSTISVVGSSHQVREPHPIIGWLDLQDEDSVVYVCFGSQNTITGTQMMELATGLEESGKRFVWVIRPPFGFDIGAEFRSDWLPDGFLERVDMRGILVHTSAPQMDILAHKAIGAFLSHCGWNSVLEALSQGVPIIGWPLAAEQAFNSKMLEEEAGVAVEVARGLEAEITKEGVKRALNTALDRHDKGGQLKRKATKMAAKLRLAAIEQGVAHKGSTVHAIDGFLHTLLHQSTY